MLFFLFATLVIYLSGESFNAASWPGLFCALTLFFSVLFHEIGHVVVARRLGGVADEIVIGPLGGLSAIRVPYEPHSELVALMAGTLVNAAICFLCALTLVITSDGGVDLVPLLQPQLAVVRQLTELNLESLLTLCFWINWCLILVNLIPVFPFDGGRSLHASLTFLWPEYDSRQSLIAICRFGKVVAALLMVLACMRYEFWPLENKFALTLLAIFIFFCSRREEIQQAETEQDEDTEFGYDFSQGYTSLERDLEDEEESEIVAPSQPKLGFLGNWLENRRQAQRLRQLELEAEDEKRVDEVLARLHQSGMRSLSQADRELLNRVSQRYRSRQD